MYSDELAILLDIALLESYPKIYNMWHFAQKIVKKIDNIEKNILPILAYDPFLTRQVGNEVLFKISKILAVD